MRGDKKIVEGEKILSCIRDDVQVSVELKKYHDGQQRCGKSLQTDRQKKVETSVSSSMCSLLVGVTETTKGRGEKNSHQDHRRTTAQTDNRAQ